eukprot:CAMPEP_0174364806 /NCGR_PEP_ID=MMETSP0811_2-20130205/74472_1 /TAXON_ID=73025 ORGANISM="Eutreptiella gymnastica-like, Strain CCMP1594" /NCGR_SAMPLE_ID=MMETSP0811_2 /ASSEMBLY_ACC=CAM_ASM_000667 /LENGTH=441 /DNA_ID=CAMNT_0015504825 /DNA_START=135 /DNA_END=1457 /DNA_ORIENTATION=+
MALPSNKETPAAGSAESSAHGDVEALLTALHTWRAQHQAAALPHTSTPSGDRVTVCLRKRPMHALEAESIGSRTGTGEMEYDCITCVNPKLYFHQQEVAFGGVVTTNMTHKAMAVHHTFAEDTSNDEVYAAAVQPVVVAALRDGGDVTCLAFGQTGAGKTHTQKAIQASVAAEVFAGLGPRRCILSFFENCGDQCFDLFNKREKVALREAEDGVVQIIGLQELQVPDLPTLLQRLDQANQLRATHPTCSSPDSSRSHAFCILHLTDPTSSAPQCCLRIVDLAGSERRNDVYGHSPERVAETKAINWSLGCLKECIRLQHDRVHNPKLFVPYRRSKLTHLLKACLAGAMGARLVFLAHVSPMHSAKAHIRGTLDYTHQLLQTAAAERAPIKKSAGVARPDRWSKRQFAAWLTQLEEGQYADLVEYFQIDGLTMAHEWRVHLE